MCVLCSFEKLRSHMEAPQKSTNDEDAGASVQTKVSPEWSPFLPSSPDALPSLERIPIPTGAYAECAQQMESKVVDLPIPRTRRPTHSRAHRPTSKSSISFVYAFNAFCSARRAVSTSSIQEAEAMLSSEALELVAYGNKEEALDASLPPRPLCVSLVIPSEATQCTNAVPYIDGLAALSDTKTEDGLPITTKVRFSIYGGDASTAVARMLTRDAYDRKIMDGTSLVVRWFEEANGHGARYRTECMSLGSTCPEKGQESRVLQMAVLKMSTLFGFAVPSAVYTNPPQSCEAYYEKQVCDCSNEFMNILHNDVEFVPSDRMRVTGKHLLKQVPGCYARLTCKELQMKGVTSADATHAFLLCADGMEEKALDYVKRYREGLPPLAGKDSELDLHAAAVHTKRVYLQGMVSLYCHGGKSGERLKRDGNWVYMTTSAIVHINDVVKDFYIFGCTVDSILPTNSAFLGYMHMHLKRSTSLYFRVFCENDASATHASTSPDTLQLPADTSHHVSSDDLFVLSALGIDLRCKRILIGDVLSYLTQTGAPKSLIDLLTSASLRVGNLRVSLSEGFASCVEAMNKHEEDNRLHYNEIERLKKLVDAALLLQCKKRPRCTETPIVVTTDEKVRMLVQAFSLKRGTHRTTMCSFECKPRCADTVHSLAETVYEAYRRTPGGETPHLQELKTVLQTYCNIVSAIAKCFHLCMVHPGKKKKAFVILGENKMTEVSVYEVTDKGDATLCGSGAIFESSEPCIVMVNESPTSCKVVPLVCRDA